MAVRMLMPDAPFMRKDQLPAALDRPAGEEGRTEVAVVDGMDRAGIVGVVQLHRPGDPLHAHLVHLLEGDHVRSGQWALLQHADGAGNIASQLHVEGHDPELTGVDRIHRSRIRAEKRRRGGIEQIGGVGTPQQHHR